MSNTTNDKIILLVRSYNRPVYLEQTLQSLAKSDIDLCTKRYIFDDYSTNKKLLKYLKTQNMSILKIKNLTLFIIQKMRVANIPICRHCII